MQIKTPYKNGVPLDDEFVHDMATRMDKDSLREMRYVDRRYRSYAVPELRGRHHAHRILQDERNRKVDLALSSFLCSASKQYTDTIGIYANKIDIAHTIG